MRTARAARRRPWSAEWPRRPGRTRCCARPRPPPRGRRGRSLDACSEDDDGVEVELAAHEATGYLRTLAGRDHAVEPFAGRTGDGDEDDVGVDAVEHGVDLVEAAEDGYALETAAAQARVVVHEADDLLAGGLAQLAEEAAAAA